MKRIFRNRSLLIIAASLTVSGIGNWITLLSVFALIVFVGHGSVAQTSWLWLAGLVPTVICSPLAGWFSDRFDRKWLMIASELLSGCAVLGIILTARIELIYALLVLQAICGSLMIPAWQAALPSLVQQDELTQANALLQQLMSCLKIGGPIIAGALLTVLRPQQAMVLDVISFGLSVLILSCLPALPAVLSSSKRGARQDSERVECVANDAAIVTQPRAELEVGVPERKHTALGTLFGSLPLSAVFLISFFLILFVGSFDLLAPVFIRDNLRQGTTFFGLLIGCIGLGATGSSVYLFLRKTKRDHWLDIIIGLALLALIPASLTLISWLHAPALALFILIVSCLLGGLGQGLVWVQTSTLLQLLAPGAVLGRLSGMLQATLGMAQLLTFLLVPLFVPAFVSFGLFMGMGTIAMVFLTICTILTLYRTRHRALQPQVAVSEN